MIAIGRQLALRRIVEQLGATDLGRDLGLDRIASLRDFRASIPVRSRNEHAEDVELRWGFGVQGGTESLNPQDDDEDRRFAIECWARAYRARAGADANPPRIAVLRRDFTDTPIEARFVGDLRGWSGELLRWATCDDALRVLRELVAFGPNVLVVPSLYVVRTLESAERMALESSLTSLHLILTEHDHRVRLRSSLPVASAAWYERSGRVAVPTLGEPQSALVLAMGDDLLEFLPYSNPEEDGRRVYAERTILPEEAIVGQRYELVASSARGFVRMRTGEHLRVVGFDAPTHVSPFPRPRIVRLTPPPADIALEGCTVAGSWLTASVRQSLTREDPALVQAEILPDASTIRRGSLIPASAPSNLDDALRDTELGGLVRTGAFRARPGRPRRLKVRVELQGHVRPELPPRLSQRIDASLQARSPAYAHLRAAKELGDPVVEVLPAGSRQASEAERIASLEGRVALPDVRVVD